MPSQSQIVLDASHRAYCYNEMQLVNTWLQVSNDALLEHLVRPANLKLVITELLEIIPNKDQYDRRYSINKADNLPYIEDYVDTELTTNGICASALDAVCPR